jgi:hypothetical protein
MLDLVERRRALQAGRSRLDGSVRRSSARLVHHFMNDDDCRCSDHQRRAAA